MYVCMNVRYLGEGKSLSPFFFVYIYMYIEIFDGIIDIHCKLEIN